MLLTWVTGLESILLLAQLGDQQELITSFIANQHLKMEYITTLHIYMVMAQH